MVERGFLIHFPFEIQHFYLFAALQSAQRPLISIVKIISGFQYFVDNPLYLK